jgi:anti-sigma B factor antagonist
MNISLKQVEGISVVEIHGDLDGTTAPLAQAQLMPLIVPGGKLLLDMSDVGYMSSAGLRLLLATYRNITGKGGGVVLVGLSEELQDTMSLTGFLDFFNHVPTLDAGIAALA